MPKGEGAQAAAAKAVAAKTPAQAVKAQKAEEKITPAVAKNKATAAAKATQGAQTPATRAAAAAANSLANKYLEAQASPGYKGVGSNFYTPPTPYIPPKDRGPGPGPGPQEPPGPGTPTPAAVTPIPPVKGGIAQSRNIRTGYLKLIKDLTANLLKNADSLLFAYNFKSIERMVSYTLEQDDQSQRQSQIVSNIKRSFSGVPLTELQIRDRLNAVVNQISQEIGDLTPASTKLAKFGMKRDNRDFQGGTPRIQNSRAVYDLELKLPSLEGFNYSVTYRIKCFDID
ncbi:hypothetical protein UFOVP359_68 [uncultured Caudovirales phage]|uniref:Uncharacterized protein n=1 Tax=uncultured Caudovirales phage TaxID=2100421 RepID=A0A6J7WUY3_9CAUD|nr:hypothetical protein UFOVP359_68 [uncultured Caudovirales phage]